MLTPHTFFQIHLQCAFSYTPKLLRSVLAGLRRSPLGKEEKSGNLMGTSMSSLLCMEHYQACLLDPANASHWPPILFLADLYTQALLTVGDDELFGTASGGRAVRTTPLTLDELVELSRQLLNSAFALYWRDEGA
jgi:hypothetical protein